MAIKRAIYLAGGGARGAYQAGVLKAIHHILQVKVLPFNVVSGASVGSINAVALAEHADDFAAGIDKIIALWGDLHCQDIFKASNYALGKSVLRNISTILIRQRQAGHLLDTEPLHELITNNMDFEKINENIIKGTLEALEIVANCYESHQTVSFYAHHNPQFEDWHYPRHISQKVVLSNEHVLASSALPLFFPVVSIDGLHYGDGSMGLIAPLRGCIRFQVDKIMILGTNPMPQLQKPETLKNADIGFAHVLGGMLNGLFLDNLDRDIEMVNRMNDIARLLSMWKKRRSPWRPINTLYLRPSCDTSEIAQAQYKSMPALLRYLLNLLGARRHSGNLLSFLLFEKEYTRELIELGFQDTIQNAHLIQEFFAN